MILILFSGNSQTLLYVLIYTAVVAIFHLKHIQRDIQRLSVKSQIKPAFQNITSDRKKILCRYFSTKNNANTPDYPKIHSDLTIVGTTKSLSGHSNPVATKLFTYFSFSSMHQLLICSIIYLFRVTEIFLK